MNDHPAPSLGGSYLRLPDGSLQRIPEDPAEAAEAEAAAPAEGLADAESPIPPKKGAK